MPQIKSMVNLLLVCLLVWNTSCKESVNNNFEEELGYPVNVQVSFDEGTESAYLTWDRVVEAVGYSIWYSYSETGAYTLLADVTTNEYTDTSIERNSKKYYKIKAYNSVEESLFSVSVSTTNTLSFEEDLTPRAMWMWDKTEGLDDTKRSALLAFCLEKDIKILYFTTGRNDYLSDPDLVLSTRTFIRDAHNNHIMVHGLTGSTDWILPEKQYVYLDAARNLAAYNNLVEEDERFDGYQADIEPYKYYGSDLPTDERIKNLTYFVDVIKQAADIFNSELDDPDDFQYGMAISAWMENQGEELKFDYLGKNQNALYHLADIVDYFAIMSYRDIASTIIEISNVEVSAMESRGKKAWVGLETMDTESVGAGGGFINFYDEGNEYMEGEIAKVMDYYKDNSGFGGMAIHHHKTYVEIKD
jgi:hypothetical protein